MFGHISKRPLIHLKRDDEKMEMVENEKPMYNERVNDILRGLASGKTREELADEAGNSNWKSIDMYMRRKNFTWDQRKQTYVPKEKTVESYQQADSSKAGHVISLLSKDGVDPRTAAANDLDSRIIENWPSI